MPYQSGSTLFALALALTVGTAGAARSEGGFLHDGGFVTRVGTAHADRPFLEDGGSITSQSVLVTPFGAFAGAPARLGDGRDFLDDGGSIIASGITGHYGRGNSIIRYDRTRTFVPVLPVGRPGFYRGTGSGAAGGGTTIIQYGSVPPKDEAPRGRGGAKIIRVAEARLDRRPIGPSGMETVQAGATRIIRLAPGYRGAGSQEESALPSSASVTDEELAALPQDALPEVVYPDPDLPSDPDASPQADVVPPPPLSVPVPTPAPALRSSQATAAGTPEASTAGFEPWTPEWLRDCVARYESFDASLGTYTDESGRRRFCTGEP